MRRFSCAYRFLGCGFFSLSLSLSMGRCSNNQIAIDLLRLRSRDCRWSVRHFLRGSPPLSFNCWACADRSVLHWPSLLLIFSVSTRREQRVPQHLEPFFFFCQGKSTNTNIYHRPSNHPPSSKILFLFKKKLFRHWFEFKEIFFFCAGFKTRRNVTTGPTGALKWTIGPITTKWGPVATFQNILFQECTGPKVVNNIFFFPF